LLLSREDAEALKSGDGFNDIARFEAGGVLPWAIG
jgi:hypothetical protein